METTQRAFLFHFSITITENEKMTEQAKLKKDKTLFLNKLGIETDLEGRVKIDQTVMKKLKPIPQGNQYKTLSVSDSLLMGFRARVNPGGSISTK